MLEHEPFEAHGLHGLGGQGGAQGGGQGEAQGGEQGAQWSVGQGEHAPQGGGYGFFGVFWSICLLATVVLGKQLSPHLISTSMTSPPILIILFTLINKLLLFKKLKKPFLFNGTNIPVKTPCGKEKLASTILPKHLPSATFITSRFANSLYVKSIKYYMPYTNKTCTK